MAGVTRSILLLSLAAALTACGPKLPPADAGEPVAQPIVLEDVPRHVDTVMGELQPTLLKPVREVLRTAPVSTTGVASDGSYGRWLTAVSEAVVYARPLPKDLHKLSERAYRDLARIAGKSKKDAPAVDLDLLARRLFVHFEKQPTDVRKTAAAYLETAFSIVG